MKDTILIIDFGSQVTKLIARRIREFGVFSQIIPYHLLKQKDLQINQVKEIQLMKNLHQRYQSSFII